MQDVLCQDQIDGDCIDRLYYGIHNNVYKLFEYLIIFENEGKKILFDTCLNFIL